MREAHQTAADQVTQHAPHQLLPEVPAAKYLGTNQRWLQVARVKGNGPMFLKIGRRVLYDTRDLDAFLEGCRRKSTSDAGI